MVDSAITDALKEKLGVRDLKLVCVFDNQKRNTSISGGCINDAFSVDTNKGRLFVKVNTSVPAASMFGAEFNGLNAIANANVIRVPKPHAFGVLSNGKGSFLVTEYVDMGSMSSSGQKNLGNQLASMHLKTAGDIEGHGGRFGLSFDNWCGSTPQINTPNSSWCEFFRVHRLKYQCERIHREYGDGELMELERRLETVLPQLMEGAGKILPSLLHGDLWGGNSAALSSDSSVPVIFDPAAFYGHSEYELGIMGMFGGYTSAFYKAYHARIPKAPGFDDRLQLYQLYHYLNHYNIFGQGYRSQCVSIMRGLLE